METVERIIVGTDGSEHSEVALRKAFGLAKLLGKPLVAVHVIDPVHIQGFPPESLVGDLTQILRDEAQKILGAVAARARQEGIQAQALVREGRPSEELCAVATERDILVVATHGRRGLGRILLGSVAENVVRHAPCPVLVIRDPGRRRKP